MTYRLRNLLFTPRNWRGSPSWTTGGRAAQHTLNAACTFLRIQLPYTIKPPAEGGMPCVRAHAHTHGGHRGDSEGLQLFSLLQARKVRRFAWRRCVLWAGWQLYWAGRGNVPVSLRKTAVCVAVPWQLLQQHANYPGADNSCLYAQPSAGGTRSADSGDTVPHLFRCVCYMYRWVV